MSAIKENLQELPTRPSERGIRINSRLAEHLKTRGAVISAIGIAHPELAEKTLPGIDPYINPLHSPEITHIGVFPPTGLNQRRPHAIHVVEGVLDNPTGNVAIKIPRPFGLPDISIGLKNISVEEGRELGSHNRSVGGVIYVVSRRIDDYQAYLVGKDIYVREQPVTEEMISRQRTNEEPDAPKTRPSWMDLLSGE